MKQLLVLILINLVFAGNKASPDIITPNQAKNHIGETKQVDGYLAKEEMINKNTRDSTCDELLYLGDKEHPAEDFILIIRNTSFKGLDEKKYQKRIALEIIAKQGFGAVGKIILYRGKPAMIINHGELLILEEVS